MSSIVKPYVGLWSKYKPAIIKMMMAADTEPQTYKLSHHEFYAFNNGKKAVFSFSVDISRGRIVQGTKESMVAQSLCEVLQSSPKASELAENSVYHFMMDNQFVLHIQKNNN